MQSQVRKPLLLTILLAASLAPAQQEINLYGGVFRPSQDVRVGVNAPPRTNLRLERILNPDVVFLNTPNPSRPTLPANARVQLVREVRTGKNAYGEVNFGRLRSGLYRVRAGNVGTLLLVTDLGLVVKRSSADALTYTADRGTGATRAATIWQVSGGRATSKAANADGVARFSSAANDGEFFLARARDEWAVSSASWNQWAAPKIRGYVYTDRPVYRPGHSVEFKGVLRRSGSLAPLAKTTVRVSVRDPFDGEVYRGSLATNAYGSFSAKFDLPAGAKLGEYRFDVRPNGEDLPYGAVEGTFGVEAYQKPEYEVTVTPTAVTAVQGDKLSVKIAAKYLFGGAVSGAHVTYNVTRSPYYPYGLDEDSLPPSDDGYDYGSDLVVNEEARLDGNGEFNLTLPLERDENGRPVTYRVEAEVEDESRKSVSGFARVLAFPAAVNVYSRTDGYVYDVGDPVRLSLNTRDFRDRPTRSNVTVELVRQTYEKVGGRWTLRETTEAKTTTTTGANGDGGVTVRPKRGGGYLMRATVRDDRGRTSTSESFAWVLSPGENWGWNYRDMTVRLDKRSYAPGDTVTALIGNPNPGAPVLVTIEGDRVRRAVVLRSSGSTLTYRFEVTKDMAPNVFVSVTALGSGNLYTSEAKVRVPDASAALTVNVKARKDKYRPGDTGTLDVTVKNAAGQGVPAELALGVVDKAIYLVRRDASTPILQVFRSERDNTVGTNSSLSFYFESGRVAKAPRAPMNEAAFGQAKEDRTQEAAPEEPREDFRDTILWVPNLLTDANGKASVNVKFPDNLTTWVTTARAHTIGARFGQTTADTLVTKDIVARLSLPTFLVRGDTATLSGIVQSTVRQAAQGRANVDLANLTLREAGSVAGTIDVPANGRARIDFDVQAQNPGTATVTFSARTNLASDALKLSLPVKARGYATTITATGSAARPDATLTVPADANLATASLRVDVSPSLLSAVTPALEYLVGYPYGCTEQTMSRFLPALLAKEALGENALPADIRKALPDIVSLGVTRLLDFQHEDGGWGFWEFDASTLEMSAYVLRGLTKAKALGVNVDNAALDRAVTYVAKAVKTDKEPLAVRAAALRALAETGRADVPTTLGLARRKDLDSYALANLALALSAVGRTSAASDVLDRLVSARKSSAKDALVFWQTPRDRDDWLWYWHDNDIQVTAVALEALAKLRPDSALIASSSRWLLNARRGPRWLSTQDTTSVVTAALALPRAKTPSGAASVILNGRDLGRVDFSRGALELNAAKLGGALKKGANVLRVTAANTPGLTFSGSLDVSREPAELSGDATRGLRIARTFEKLVATWNAKEKRMNYARTPLLRGGKLDSVAVGDLVLVTVKVRPDRAARYVLVSDPLPAGLRPLDERSLVIQGLQNSDDLDAWNFWYAGRDFRDDRVDLYADYVEGWQTMQYVLRATTPGTFTALPTHAELMYDPDVRGDGPAATFTVKDRGR
ncbi:alpha-2-macroglobulin family protein [Deinococcus yavapaiensis]|uniref:Alpha-2-macroglobulin family protein n=1 Tax=Deinococcus yavapaiensis KR-236 TaxID=694435 RepID=A0A318SLC8_9DEIO|nr:MG2 domain-containing protein [Deinococcus yavapaiensis]PYE53352.1 hypothetical protein DES52_109126 [Deinococcus yavapaiensis KR-236]